MRDVALRTPQCAAWPAENIVRGNYYLSQVLKTKSPWNDEALSMEKEAINELNELLKKDSRGKGEEYANDYPMLFDYLVHWEFRLVTPRKLTPEGMFATGHELSIAATLWSWCAIF